MDMQQFEFSLNLLPIAVLIFLFSGSGKDILNQISKKVIMYEKQIICLLPSCEA